VIKCLRYILCAHVRGNHHLHARRARCWHSTHWLWAELAYLPYRMESTGRPQIFRCLTWWRPSITPRSGLIHSHTPTYLPKRVAGASRADAPPATVVWVTPQQVTHWALVWHLQPPTKKLDIDAWDDRHVDCIERASASLDRQQHKVAETAGSAAHRCWVTSWHSRIQAKQNKLASGTRLLDAV
jgi:hypothetical protein